MTRTVLLLVRAVLAIGVASAGVMLWAEHAWAGVSVTPDHGARGDAAEVSLRVTDDRPGAYTTKVELRFPADTPVAEVYPMSVPDWAPSLTSRPVDQPLDGVHHGQVTEVVSAITWVRAGAPTAHRFAELRVSMGPLPDAERLLLPVVQTYSDGTVVTWADPPGGARPAAVLTLVPAQAAAADAADAATVAGPGEPVVPGLGTAGQLGVALAVGLGGGAVLGVGHLVLTGRQAPARVDAAFANRVRPMTAAGPPGEPSRSAGARSAPAPVDPGAAADPDPAADPGPVPGGGPVAGVPAPFGRWRLHE